jgi:hypothetical protein
VANHRGRRARARVVVLAACMGSALAACGDRHSAGADPGAGGGETRRAALDSSEEARAAYFRAEVARLRDIANQQRQLSAAYARWTAPAGASKDWNATLKASADARAAAVDQIVVSAQALADFHAARAGAQ